MKSTRALALALALCAVLPTAGAAQQRSTNTFENSWFWGVKGGSMMYSAPTKSNGNGALVGLDWLITRRKGGLYVSYDQSFLKSSAIISDSIGPADTTAHVVDFKNLRRVSAMAVGFPGSMHYVRPYVGLGFSYNSIATITPRYTPTSAEQQALGNAIVQNYQTAFSPIAMVGVQGNWRNLGAFVQATGTTVTKNFFLYAQNRPIRASFEAGLRWNVGSSIDASTR
ncbi:MAG: hypothetical protein JWO05_610 [Gemmatimonadetes bacterium]|nr:hypothetical protein [Gemmatimonadota bacterium]